MEKTAKSRIDFPSLTGFVITRRYHAGSALLRIQSGMRKRAEPSRHGASLRFALKKRNVGPLIVDRRATSSGEPQTTGHNRDAVEAVLKNARRQSLSTLSRIGIPRAYAGPG